MNKKRDRKCPFEECYLPDNNYKYAVQLLYLMVSGLFLIKDSKEFTFFSILMFVAPILLDLVYTKMKGKAYIVISRIYIGFNSLIVAFCVVGMSGVFVDKGNAFAVNDTVMIYPGLSFDKKILLIPMAVDLLIPIMMHRACPSKKTKKMIESGRERRKAGNL